MNPKQSTPAEVRALFESKEIQPMKTLENKWLDFVKRLAENAGYMRLLLLLVLAIAYAVAVLSLVGAGIVYGINTLFKLGLPYNVNTIASAAGLWLLFVRTGGDK